MPTSEAFFRSLWKSVAVLLIGQAVKRSTAEPSDRVLVVRIVDRVVAGAMKSKPRLSYLLLPHANSVRQAINDVFVFHLVNVGYR